LSTRCPCRFNNASASLFRHGHAGVIDLISIISITIATGLDAGLLRKGSPKGSHFPSHRVPAQADPRIRANSGTATWANSGTGEFGDSHRFKRLILQEILPRFGDSHRSPDPVHVGEAGQSVRSGSSWLKRFREHDHRSAACARVPLRPWDQP
jgi:hypothetical protein